MGDAELGAECLAVMKMIVVPVNYRNNIFSKTVAVETVAVEDLIEKPERINAYEKENEIHDLLIDGGGDSDGGACHPGGGADRSTIQG